MENNFLDKFLEYDYNPFILYSNSGKVLSLNEEAQHLLAKIPKKVIFDLAISYAAKNFGFNRIFLDLEFDRFKFFGLSVGYEDEDKIGIQLYKNPPIRLKSINNINIQKSNIYSLIDLVISTNSIKSSANFIKEFDPALPEIRINTNSFIKVLDKIYKLFINSAHITTKLYLKVGEFIKHKDKKYKLFIIEIIGDKQEIDVNTNIDNLAIEINSIISFKPDRVVMELPLIN